MKHKNTNQTDLKSFEELKYQVLKSVVNEDDERLIFTLENGDTYMLYHEQDCCESVTIEDICGDLSDLVGTVWQAEESSNEGEDSTYGDHETWTFYKIATMKGYVTIRWYGSSNGYYSESVDWKAC